YRIVWKSLRPLQATIQTLGLLSSPEGNTSRPIDEIGTLSHSISAFRHKTEQLARDRAQQDRIRRRQEAVIARELGILSNAIDASSRQEIQAMVDRQAGVQDGDDNLRYLAEVMGDMRQRLIEQHQRLSTMVIELRDALITKTALAGLQ